MGRIEQLAGRFFMLYMGWVSIRYWCISVLQAIYTVEKERLSLGGTRTLSRPEEEHLKQGAAYRCLVYLGAHYRDSGVPALALYSIYSVLYMSFYYLILVGGDSTLLENLKFRHFLQNPNATRFRDQQYISSLKELLIGSYSIHRDSMRKKKKKCTKCASLTNLDIRASSYKKTNHNKLDLKDIINKLHYVPDNRTKLWHARLNLIWKRAFVIASVYNFVVINLTLVATKVIMIHRDKLPLADRLSILEETLWSLLVSEIFPLQGCKLFISEIDQRKLNSSVFHRVRCFRDKLQQIAQYCSTIEGLRPEQLNQIQVYCNRRSLEIYLAWRYMMKQQAEQKNVTGILISQWIFFFIGNVAVCILLSRSFDIHWFRFLVPTIGSIYMTCMLVCMILSSSLSRLNRYMGIIWSILAYSQLQANQVQLVVRNANEQSNQYSTRRASCIPFKSFQREQVSLKLLEPHTRKLWLQMVRDTKPVAFRATYVILGFFPISYRSLTKLNYWLISLILATISNNLHFLPK